MAELTGNWASEWETKESMAFFLMHEKVKGGKLKVYVVNKDTLKLYHVVDAPLTLPHCDGYYPSCVYSRGKLYLVLDHHPHDVYVCDLSSSCYVWTRGPPMHSIKHHPHLVAYNGLIFALSTPDFRNFNFELVPPISTFEVLDTSLNRWEVLPDPPLKDYNNKHGRYSLISHTILDDLLYFVFDYTGLTKDSVVYTKVLSFDPKLRQWGPSKDSNADDMVDDEDEDDTYDMLSLYIDFSARRHERGVKVVEFFKGDPSRRMFILDPPGVNAMPPCFYTYDCSTFDRKTLVNAVREFSPPSVSDINSRDFLAWFQLFVRPYLSSVTGLSQLMKILVMQPKRAHNCFVLPCSYEPFCWTFCIVAFTQFDRTFTAVAKFRLRLRHQINNSFHAEDFEVRAEYLPNSTANSNIPLSFSRIP